MDIFISVVVSVYNEEEALEQFYGEASKALAGLGLPYELIFVNDGSTDKSPALLRTFAALDKKVKFISFSRNFGHEAAMIAGLDYSRGSVVICMDADLQHPPEFFGQIVSRFREGYEVVSMVRTSNPDAGRIKNITSSAFYWLLNRISGMRLEPNASDFFAINRRVVEILKENYRDRVRFLRGYVQSVGFKKCTLTYEARARVAGKSKYSIRKLLAFSLEIIMCFSDLPLKLGFFASALSFAGAVALFAGTCLIRGEPFLTCGGLAALLCFFFSVLFLLVGIIGEYLALLLAEVKDRPIYLVQEKRNL